MNSSPGIFKLKGTSMHYAWGGTQFIPQLLGLDNHDQIAFAEYWMGAHALAPATLSRLGIETQLVEAIKENPEKVLSKKVFQQFGELPYLFKVLDVKEVLSIQVHPSKEEAEKGFAKEQEAGIPLDAPNRNYKDANHKPEVMVALSDFWLLHGFKSELSILKTLEEESAFSILLTLYKKEGLKSLFQYFMELDQDLVNSILGDLVQNEIRKRKNGELNPSMPGWWVAAFYQNKASLFPIDRAIFSIYLFNIVQIKPGQGIFQAAGVPHAYLQGQCIELMANSDNVLRGGLTPKHIDLPELMKHTQFKSITPHILNGENRLPGEKLYPCSVPDFGIAQLQLDEHTSYENHSHSLEIWIVTDGGVIVNQELTLKKGEALAIFANENYRFTCSGQAKLFKAYVPE